MKITDSSAANIGVSAVKAITSSTSEFNQYMCFQAISVRPPAGAIGVIKEGNGGLTFTSSATYSGPTQINGGQIVLSSSAASSLFGVISGTGVLTKTGTATLSIGGNNTYSGGTVYSPTSTSAIITFSGINAFGTGLFTVQGQGEIRTGGNITLPNNFQFNIGTIMQYRTTGANTITLSGNIAGSGSLNKTGNGTLRLDGTLTYTGSTTITAGFIRAIKTNGSSTATATFQSGGLSLVVSFNVSPPSGVTTFQFFQGTTTQTYAIVTLVGLPAGSTATYNSANSTLSVTVL